MLDYHLMFGFFRILGLVLGYGCSPGHVLNTLPSNILFDGRLGAMLVQGYLDLGNTMGCYPYSIMWVVLVDGGFAD